MTDQESPRDAVAIDSVPWMEWSEGVRFGSLECAFLAGLRELSGRRFRSLDLYSYIRKHVISNAKQLPRR
ncbi:hypothetical protein BH10PSE7_BH10PSE7_01060 [soil metagenome]